MIPDPTIERLLKAVQDLADTAIVGSREQAEHAKVMVRRMAANEQYTRRIKDDVVHLQMQVEKSSDYGARVAVLEYQINEYVGQLGELAKEIHGQKARSFVVILAFLILLVILTVSTVLTLLR